MSEAIPKFLGEREAFLLLEDLFAMSNRLAGCSERASELILREKRKPTSPAKLLFFRLYFKVFISLAEEMLSRPRRIIIRKRKLTPSWRLSRVDAGVLVEAVKRGYDSDPETFPDTACAPDRITTAEAYETRFLLWFTNLLLSYLNDVIPSKEKQAAFIIAPEKLIRARQSLAWLKEALEDMGITPIDYPQNPPLSFFSHPIYSRLWRLYRKFEGMIAPLRIEESIKLMDWWALYEIWCSLSVLFCFEELWMEHDQEAAERLADELWLRTTEDLKKLGTKPFSKDEEKPLWEAKFFLGNGITLYFQRRFPYYENDKVEHGLGSVSTEYIPDICFVASSGQLPILILDAKFQPYGSLIGKPEAKEELRGQIPGLRKMHIYRDAIVQYGEPAVWGAFALAPLAPSPPARVKFKPFNEDWKMRHRFGAIEMRPSRKSDALGEIRRIVEKWKEGT
jgi:hypothetical protein